MEFHKGKSFPLRELTDGDHWQCPLCDTYWHEKPDVLSSCDHESGWYRRWLKQAAERIDELERDRRTG